MAFSALSQAALGLSLAMHADLNKEPSCVGVAAGAAWMSEATCLKSSKHLWQAPHLHTSQNTIYAAAYSALVQHCTCLLVTQGTGAGVGHTTPATDLACIAGVIEVN